MCHEPPPPRTQVVSADAPLAPSEDRTHAHTFSTFVQARMGGGERD